MVNYRQVVPKITIVSYVDELRLGAWRSQACASYRLTRGFNCYVAAHKQKLDYERSENDGHTQLGYCEVANCRMFEFLFFIAAMLRLMPLIALHTEAWPSKLCRPALLFQI